MANPRVLMLAAVLAAGCAAAAEPTSALQQARSIDLPGVHGRIDHLAADVAGKRLFVAALGNDTLEVIDLTAGRRVRQVEGLHEPQGVAYLPDQNRVVVTNGEGASVSVYDAASFDLVSTIKLRQDPDNVRYDPATTRLYIGHGSGRDGGLAVIDARTWAKLADISLAGHPESFQLEAKGSRVFVNVPSARQIAVVDRHKGAVVATWPLEGAADNFPMALDEEHGRLFVGCRKPAKLLVFDTRTGRIVASLDSAGDADDIFYEAAGRRLYVSGGAGSVSVFEQTDADHYTPLGEAPTGRGARTSLWEPKSEILYVAVPQVGARQAEVRVFNVGQRR